MGNVITTNPEVKNVVKNRTNLKTYGDKFFTNNLSLKVFVDANVK